MVQNIDHPGIHAVGAARSELFMQGLVRAGEGDVPCPRGTGGLFEANAKTAPDLKVAET